MRWLWLLLPATFLLGIAARPSDGDVTIKEKFFISRTCPGGHAWYVEKLEDSTVTVACTYNPDEDDE